MVKVYYVIYIVHFYVVSQEDFTCWSIQEFFLFFVLLKGFVKETASFRFFKLILDTTELLVFLKQRWMIPVNLSFFVLSEILLIDFQWVILISQEWYLCVIVISLRRFLIRVINLYTVKIVHIELILVKEWVFLLILLIWLLLHYLFKLVLLFLSVFVGFLSLRLFEVFILNNLKLLPVYSISISFDNLVRLDILKFIEFIVFRAWTFSCWLDIMLHIVKVFATIEEIIRLNDILSWLRSLWIQLSA